MPNIANNLIIPLHSEVHLSIGAEEFYKHANDTTII